MLFPSKNFLEKLHIYFKNTVIDLIISRISLWQELLKLLEFVLLHEKHSHKSIYVCTYTYTPPYIYCAWGLKVCIGTFYANQPSSWEQPEKLGVGRNQVDAAGDLIREWRVIGPRVIIIWKSVVVILALGTFFTLRTFDKSNRQLQSWGVPLITSWDESK